VVHDFRADDMAAGGEGARMVAVYYRALANAAGLERPLAVVMLDGVAHVTFIGEDGSLMAFDVGPGAAAEAIASSSATLPAPPRLWLIAGGAERNAAVVAALAGLVAKPVYPAATMGWPSEHVEAEAFAYLAVRAIKKLPLSFPGTTGVRQPISGGRLARAPGR
jgi:1,6-anhydro-N-acetylmuramate kinase